MNSQDIKTASDLLWSKREPEFILDQLKQMAGNSKLFLVAVVNRVFQEGIDKGRQDAEEMHARQEEYDKPKYLQITTIDRATGQLDVSYAPFTGNYQVHADAYLEEARAQGKQASFQRHQHMIIVTLEDRLVLLRCVAVNYAGYTPINRQAFPDIRKPCKNCEREETHTFVETWGPDTHRYSCNICDAKSTHKMLVEAEA